jgi:hypothetical protein
MQEGHVPTHIQPQELASSSGNERRCDTTNITTLHGRVDVGQGHTAGLRASRSGGFDGQTRALGHALPTSYPTPITQQCAPLQSLHFSRPRTHRNQFPTRTLPPHPSHDKWGSATPLETPAGGSQHTASFVDCWIEPTHPHVAPRTPLTSTRARTSRQKSEGPRVCVLHSG